MNSNCVVISAVIGATVCICLNQVVGGAILALVAIIIYNN